MRARLKALVTLGVLALLLLLGITWGWSAMTSPFPKSAPAKACINKTMRPGSRVSAPKVLVSVFNASTRAGLAEATISQFENQGFGAGTVGNAPKGTVVPFAQIWSKDPTNPAVRLVLSRLGPKAHVVAQHLKAPGIVVVVGNSWGRLVQGQSSIKVTTRARICSPPTG